MYVIMATFRLTWLTSGPMNGSRRVLAVRFEYRRNRDNEPSAKLPKMKKWHCCLRRKIH